AILVSGFVSLTLTPMLCSRFLKPGGHERHGYLYQKTEAAFEALRSGYDWSLRKVMAHPFATLMLSFVVMGATAWLFMAIPKGFLPAKTRAIFLLSPRASRGSPLRTWCATRKKPPKSSETAPT